MARKIDNFDPNNVLLAIATNIPVRLKTFVVQGHKYVSRTIPHLPLVGHAESHPELTPLVSPVWKKTGKTCMTFFLVFCVVQDMDGNCKDSVNIYSPSCRFKPVLLTLFYEQILFYVMCS